MCPEGALCSAESEETAQGPALWPLGVIWDRSNSAEINWLRLQTPRSSHARPFAVALRTSAAIISL